MKQTDASDWVLESTSLLADGLAGWIGVAAGFTAILSLFVWGKRWTWPASRTVAMAILVPCLVVLGILAANFGTGWIGMLAGGSMFFAAAMSMCLHLARIEQPSQPEEDTATNGMLDALFSRENDAQWYFQTDESGAVRSASKLLSALAGDDGGTIQGRTFPDLFSPEKAGAGWQRFLLALDSRSAVNCTVELRHDNIFKWWKIRSRPQFSAEGQFIGHLGLAVNVTSERQACGNLVAENRRLAAKSESRAALLDDLAQQLRAPVNTILGFAELLGSATTDFRLEDEHRPHVEMLLASSRGLSAFINDISDFARADRGSLHLLEQEIDAAELVETAVKHCHEAAEAADVTIVANIVDGIELRCDAVRICRVLVTLVSRAIKASPHCGTVQVSFARTPDAGLAVAIRDEGMWIGRDQTQALFTADIQANGMDALALPIARMIAMLHGGDVTVDGAPDGGTMCRLVFPGSRIAWSVAESSEAIRAA